ncbi:MAG: D-amino acid aminotransferase [Gammaproteobacteria bacterium]|nr:D-amino acid aminotransferase [Gammaproteobacteria bacterium]
MSTIAYLNGAYGPIEETRISVLDRGFLFGDGVYEVFPVYGGKGFLQDRHLERLEKGLATVRIENPHTRAQWNELLDELIRRNGGGNQAIYLQVTRGVAPRLHAFPEGVTPTVLVTSRPLATATDIKPARVVTRPDIRWGRCDIKSISLLGNVLLRQEAVDADCTESILIRDNQVTEGAASNVFVVRNNRVVTPPDKRLLFSGTTRNLVIELATAAGIPVDMASIPATTLHDVDEMWITGSIMEVVPVIEVDGHPVGDGRPGPFWKKIWSLFQDYRDRYSI